LWGVSEAQQVDYAVIRSASMEETTKIRYTVFALRQIDYPSAQNSLPRTELEYLESSFGLQKSIR
jgi:hypothetical protein